MVVFGSKSSSAKTKLFDQPLDKLFNPKAIKHFNETIAASNSRSPPALCQSLSAPLTSSTLTWAKLSQENSATKRKRAAARLRRFTIDANNNTSSLIQSLTSAPIVTINRAPLCISHPHHQQTHRLLESNYSSPAMMMNSPAMSTAGRLGEQDSYDTIDGELKEDARCRLLLNVLPEPIKCLLNEIYLRGPSTVGIFRKSPNAKHCKELKQKLESSEFNLSAIEQYQVNVIASVFKEWLRSLPDCLLMSRLYPQWIDVAKLIEPLHSHLQQLQHQQSVDQTFGKERNQMNSGPSDGNNTSGAYLSQSSDIRQAKQADSVQTPPSASLRSSDSATSPMTDNSQMRLPSESSMSSSHDDIRQQLSRALSCSIMTSDSGHSSTSTSPSSAMSTSFDSCGDATATSRSSEARAKRQHFQKANSHETQSQQQQHQSNQAASYLKRKCYQQRQQQHLTLIDCEPDTHNTGDSINNDSHANKSPPISQSNETTAKQQVDCPGAYEFSLKERRFECIRVVRQLLEALNETNLILLRAIICVLWHIADNSQYNKMSSSNLGVCIGQSLLNDELQQNHIQTRGKKLYSFSLSMSPSSQSNSAGFTTVPSPESSRWPHSTQSNSNFIKRHRRARSQCLLASTLSLTNLSHLSSSPAVNSTSNGHLASSISSNYLDSSSAQETAKFVPILVAFMIDNAKELFGSDVMNLFGPRRPLSHTDGNEELHSNDNLIVSSEEQTTKVSDQQRSIDIEPRAGTACNTTRDRPPVRADSVPLLDLFKNSDHKPIDYNQNNAATNNNSLECRSIIVTSEQIRPHENVSGLFVKPEHTGQNPDYQFVTSSTCSSTLEQHKCKSVLVHVGSQSKTGDHSTQADVGVSAASNCGVSNSGAGIKSADNLDHNSDSATTSILIVNTPKKLAVDHKFDESSFSAANRQIAISDDLSNNMELCSEAKPDSQMGDCFFDDCVRPDSCSSSSPLIVDSHRPDERVESETADAVTSKSDDDTVLMPVVSSMQQRTDKQQRPLSVSESTTSSSRASSSTSGVHSESPAFSCERDSASNNSSGPNSTNTCPSSAASSRCVSISSPTSSVPSSCTSPVEMGSPVDVVDSSHQHHLQIVSGGATKTISYNEAMRHNLLGQVNPQVVAAAAADRTHSVRTTSGSVEQACQPQILRANQRNMKSRANFERPKSMVSLRGPAGSESMHYQHDGRTGGQYQQQQYSMAGCDGKDNRYASDGFRSHTLNRHTSASSQLVNLNRLPKIPFQYTTSNYGGEAVLFCPSATHLSQQQRQARANVSVANAARHQRGGDHCNMPQAQPRGCNRIQSLDRLTQLHYPSSQLHQQQPQRSHVLMLRDYYLSLQEQSQKQQQYNLELLKRHQQQQQQQQQQQHECKQQMLSTSQRPSVNNTPAISNHFQLIHQRQQQQQQQQQQRYRQAREGLMMPATASSAEPRRASAANSNAIHVGGETTKTNSRNSNHALMMEQPTSAAVAHQQVQPRMARIRPNQFNGLYVRRATSPMRATLDGASLIRLDPDHHHRHHHHLHQASVGGGVCDSVALTAGGGTQSSNLMAASQSSLSQQSSKMSSSSSAGQSSDDEEVCSYDECSTGGWMESTLV